VSRTASDLPRPPGVTLLDPAPVRVGLERRWRVRLGDGRPGLLAQLLPELARDEAVRRRYVQDVERLRALRAPSVAEIVALGPAPDPRDPGADPPWRLREDPPGENLEALLARAGALPVDQALQLGALLVTALADIHRRGATLRDLHPRHVLLAPDGAVRFLDVGLARVDVLSTRTAASIVLEGSPYHAPEQLRSGTVDARADLYSWGVLVWRALTGALPFGDGPAILRPRADLPDIHELRPGVPPHLSPLLVSCLAHDPAQRPRSARELVDWLRGDATAGTALATAPPVLCQACGEALRPALRLCPRCGHAAVQFTHVRTDEDAYAIDLMAAREDDLFVRRLRGFLDAVSDAPVRSLNFLVGNESWYSKEERSKAMRTPTRLVSHVTRGSAAEIQRRLSAQGIQVEARPLRQLQRRERNATIAGVGGVAVIVASAFLLAISLPLGFTGIGLGAAIAIGGAIAWATRKAPRSGPLVRLRDAPVALPATDALVARLCAQLPAASPDVRDTVAELAVLIQHLVDQRARQPGAADVERLTRPLAPLVDQVCAAVADLAAIDAQLRDLDEGALVRALAAAEARGEPRARHLDLLDGLERLRTLEEQRSRQLSGLLEATSLIERTLNLALAVVDADASYERDIHLALASLR
jgi:hypothetical protein